MKRSAALALLLLLIPPGARGEPAVGDGAPPVLAIAGKHVPLPDGNWILAGRAVGTVMQGIPLGSYGTIRNLVLFRIAPSGALDAMAEINVNEMAVADGWGIAADCERSDLMLTVVRSQAGWDAACFFIAHTMWHADTDLPDAWRQAELTAAKRGLRLPTDTVTAGFRVANRRDVIDLRFHFVADGTGRQRAGWAPAFDRELAEWSAMMIGCIEAGLKNRLPASLALPAPGAADAARRRAGMLHRRQERLSQLHAAGALSTGQFAAQSALLRRAEAADSHDGIDPATADFYRLLSFQGLSVTSDAIVTFLWTAQSVQAAALTLLQTGLRTGRTYVVGYLWDQYGGTSTRPDAARTIDFRYGAIDR